MGEKDTRTAMGDKPDIPVEPDAEELAEKCASNRDELSPRQTADCAGIGLAEQYENEEDGGS